MISPGSASHGKLFVRSGIPLPTEPYLAAAHSRVSPCSKSGEHQLKQEVFALGRGIRFTAEFKREAVRLALTSGRPRAEIAEDLGVGLSSLTRWVGQYRDEEMLPEIKDDLQAELKRLRKENLVLPAGA